MTVSKLDVGVCSGKLNEPPKSCIPNKAKMKMKRKRRKSKDMMDDKAFIRAITRLRKGDQYLKVEKQPSNHELLNTIGSFLNNVMQLIQN